MKKMKLFILIILIGMSLVSAQNTYFDFGIPDTNSKLYDGELIILEPFEDDFNGHFTKQSINEIDKLKVFLIANCSEFHFKIFINSDYRGEDKFNFKLTERRTEMLKTIFDSDATFKSKVNYEIIPKGEENLLFNNCTIDSLKSQQHQNFLHWLNNRVEIYVYKKGQ